MAKFKLPLLGFERTVKELLESPWLESIDDFDTLITLKFDFGDHVEYISITREQYYDQ